MSFLSGLERKLFVYLPSKKINKMNQVKGIVFLIFVFALTSCSITEKMIINENGSGKFSYEIDGSKMMSMIGNTTKDEKSTKKKGKKRND